MVKKYKADEHDRATAQRERSSIAQAKARKESKAKSKRDNISQAVDDVRSSTAFQAAAMVVGRGRGRGGKGKAPAMDVKPRTGSGIGGTYTSKLSPTTKRIEATRERLGKTTLGNLKAIKAKTQRKAKASVNTPVTDRAIQTTRKSIATGQRRAKKLDDGKVYVGVRRHKRASDSSASPKAAPKSGPKAKDKFSESEGAAHITGPTPAYAKATAKAKAVLRGTSPTPTINKSPKSKALVRQAKKGYADGGDPKARVKRKRMTPGQVVIGGTSLGLIEAGHTKDGKNIVAKAKAKKVLRDMAEKKRADYEKEQVELRKKSASFRESYYAKNREANAKKRRAKEAAQKNKRLNIRKKSAAQVQSRDYPSKEK